MLHNICLFLYLFWKLNVAIFWPKHVEAADSKYLATCFKLNFMFKL